MVPGPTRSVQIPTVTPSPVPLWAPGQARPLCREAPAAATSRAGLSKGVREGSGNSLPQQLSPRLSSSASQHWALPLGSVHPHSIVRGAPRTLLGHTLWLLGAHGACAKLPIWTTQTFLGVLPTLLSFPWVMTLPGQPGLEKHRSPILPRPKQSWEVSHGEDGPKPQTHGQGYQPDPATPPHPAPRHLESSKHWPSGHWPDSLVFKFFFSQYFKFQVIKLKPYNSTLHCLLVHR